MNSIREVSGEEIEARLSATVVQEVDDSRMFGEVDAHESVNRSRLTHLTSWLKIVGPGRKWN